MIRNNFHDHEMPRGRRVALVLAALAATALTAGLALAPTIARAAGTPAVRVQVSDLNLALERDRNRLERRISAAIEQVCTPTQSGLSASARDRKRLAQCRLQARQQVQQQLAARGLLSQQTASSQ
jgi:UrcA family protein